ncbi:ATP synthase F1 subunit delta [Telmatobacter sp. DSM 110680]|uniref:ATP synthase subunit delta n=1 Tax=Telmatobacter sp. DSM 110680 TaxID=3036704 RepID=A0AAU7DJI8_9BACT
MAAAFAARYARAFADVVASAHLDGAALDRQFNDFLGTWDGSKELRELFINPAVPALQKVSILDKLNAKMGLQRELRNLLAVLINNDRIGEVHEVALAWRAEMQERLGIRQAEIVTARELGNQEREELVAGVGKLAGSRIEPTFKLDESIIGGTVVRIGSTVYDGSVRGRLERLKEALVAG